LNVHVLLTESGLLNFQRKLHNNNMSFLDNSFIYYFYKGK